MALRFEQADYGNPEHAAALIDLLDEYAREEVGGGTPLSPYVREHLALALAKTPGAFSVLGFDATGHACALANCFQTLSTFSCRPLVNIHDLVIARAVRGQGVSQQLLQFIESHARSLGCCKMTLEVLEGHDVAKRAYFKFGFRPYQLNDAMGNALFMHKSLDGSSRGDGA